MNRSFPRQNETCINISESKDGKVVIKYSDEDGTVMARVILPYSKYIDNKAFYFGERKVNKY